MPATIRLPVDAILSRLDAWVDAMTKSPSAPDRIEDIDSLDAVLRPLSAPKATDGEQRQCGANDVVKKQGDSDAHAHLPVGNENVRNAKFDAGTRSNNEQSIQIRLEMQRTWEAGTKRSELFKNSSQRAQKEWLDEQKEWEKCSERSALFVVCSLVTEKEEQIEADRLLAEQLAKTLENVAGNESARVAEHSRERGGVRGGGG